MKNAKLPTVRLHPNRHKRLSGGHPWIYSNEVQMDAPAKALPAGSVARLVDAGGTPLGVIAFNPHTLIAGRLLSRDADLRVDRDFFIERIGRAVALRDRLFPHPFYRVIHAEADGLPGLIIDRYGDVVTIQANAAFVEAHMEDIVAALDAAFAPRAIMLRNDSTQRALEGMAEESQVLRGAFDGPVELLENGVRYLADLVGGQKTGWFYDQRDNRAYAARFAKDARVLDVFSYTGSFALACAAAGAKEVTAIDRSQPALDLAAKAAALNGVADICRFVRADAFNEMEKMAEAGQVFDLVIVDPPAFVKAKKDLIVGCRAYRRMCRLGARLTAPGGILVAASCSHNVDPPTFAEQVARGLTDAGRTGRILRTSGAGADHPVHPHLPESAYLKAMTLVVD
jgi:23S rRNA (cytosine1962-C5)-methyltransferase